MYIIIGLGNPTAQYEGTRHNVGFDVIDRLGEKYNIACLLYTSTNSAEACRYNNKYGNEKI